MPVAVCGFVSVNYSLGRKVFDGTQFTLRYVRVFLFFLIKKIKFKGKKSVLKAGWAFVQIKDLTGKLGIKE